MSDRGDSLDQEQKNSAERSLGVFDTPSDMTQIEILERRIIELRAEISQSHENNERLASALKAARDHLVALRAEVEKLAEPPGSYGVVVGLNDDGSIDVMVAGKKIRTVSQPSIDRGSLEIGKEVLLNDSFVAVSVRPSHGQGEVVTVKEALDDGRVVIFSRADEERVVGRGATLLGVPLRSGDHAIYNSEVGLLSERIIGHDSGALTLEQVPNVTYEDIGGLDAQIEAIRDAVELPYIHKSVFQAYDLPTPKGILLYGPPGCGKTLIAKAVANSLAQKVASIRGEEHVKSYFLSVKGPELLNKFVGETERQIRVIFQRAREFAAEGVPVIVFFDEMDSLFRTRGTGISSDMESTVVPQLLAEIDGVESLRDVIVIGATNREDLIDPAILRPGRLDVKIKIERPNRDAAGKIFEHYLPRSVPVNVAEVQQLGGGDIDKAIQNMVEKTVERMYELSDENRFLEVTYQSGDKEILYFKDFASGAMIENIVRRAKKLAVKREISGLENGLTLLDLLNSVHQEFAENEDLPNTTNPDDWARISGKKGESIVYIRTLMTKSEHPVKGARSIKQSGTGQYL